MAKKAKRNSGGPTNEKGLESKGPVGGRISTEQEKFIRANLDELGWEGVAHAIQKTVEALKNYCERKGILPKFDGDGEFSEKNLVKAELIGESFFAFIKEQLTDVELEFFKEQYAAHVMQFSKVSSVLFNEKMQIVHLVRNEILLDRVFKRQKECLEENEEIKLQLRKYGRTGDGDLNAVRALKEIMATNNSMFASFNKEAKDLQDKIGSIRSDLNATRAQRTKDMKSLNTTFASYCAALDDEVIRRREGEYISIFRAAMEKERRRLSEWHKYGDGEVDIPLLTPEVYASILKKEADAANN
jgi:hypothetical protein